MNFGANLKKIRKTLKLTQDRLSNLINVSQRTISHYENGDCEPDIIIICRLADALNVTVEQLVGYDAKNDSERYTELKSITHKFYLNRKFADQNDIIAAIGTHGSFEQNATKPTEQTDNSDDTFYF